jgi:hypothetical protein
VIWGIISTVNLFRKTSLKLKPTDELKKNPLIIKKSGILNVRMNLKTGAARPEYPVVRSPIE